MNTRLITFVLGSALVSSCAVTQPAVQRPPNVVLVMTDDQGNATEMERSWACSRTVYAPGVGPVYTREWRSTAGDSVLQDPAGYLEIEAALVDTGVSEI